MGASTAEVLAHQFDVLVVGAGPAGLSAATVLADHGISVLVLEEHEMVGEPVHCTGIVGLDTFDEIDLGRETICSVSRVARFLGRGGRTVMVDTDGVAAAVIDRGRFDRALADRAAASGATIVCGARVRSIDVSGRGVVAIVQHDGRIESSARARVCVLACGAHYRFNRRLGLGIPSAYLQSAQMEAPFTAVDAVEIDLDRALAPHGFAWVVPLRRGEIDMARVGLMTNHGAAERFGEHARRLAARHGVHVAHSRPRIKLLPLGPVKRTFADRVLAVGDAAGLAKSTTGGGIYYSLLSGRFAAETLVSALKQDRLEASTLREYESLWKSRLGPELRAGLAFRTLATRFDDRAIDALLELAAVDGLVPLLRRTANVNWHGPTAIALLRHPGFRRILLSAIWA